MLKKKTSARRPIKTVLDIGHKTVRCAIGRRTGSGAIELLGYGACESQGIRDGAIVNLDALEDAICAAIRDAESNTGEVAREVSLAISYPGNFVPLEAAMPCDDQDITSADVQRICRKALTTYLDDAPKGANVLGFYPSRWMIDEHEVDNPIGLQGSTLALDAIVSIAPSNICASYRRAVSNIGLKLERLASSTACAAWGVFDRTNELPLLVMDIGAGIIKVSFLVNGKFVWMNTIKSGGIQLTQDIAYNFDVDPIEAERIKVEYASLAAIADDQVFDSADQGVPSDRIDFLREKGSIQKVILPRIERQLREVGAILPAIIMENYPNTRIYLTGEGAKLPGLGPHVATFFGRSTRVMSTSDLAPGHESFDRPDYATLMGLLKMELDDTPDIIDAKQTLNRSFTERILSRWFSDV